MATFKFYKYQGTGNDFIMIDDRHELFPYQHKQKSTFDNNIIINLCHRRFGIGADGLILIRNHKDYDFEVIYFNADGTQSLCGNGSRCAVIFARSLAIIENNTTFIAIDGPHDAFIENDEVHLKMGNVHAVTRENGSFFMDTGSPHYIKFINDLNEFDVVKEGRKIRYDAKYGKGGTNVNFVSMDAGGGLFVRTYERGVENETYSCGTGVTAASLAASYHDMQSPILIKTKGGMLKVSFDRGQHDNFENIYLIGPAGMVFEGIFEL